MENVKIAVLSGKGGTGKTTLAVNLAVVMGEVGKQVQYLDCDVEEPNGHIFLKPEITFSEAVAIPVPVVDEDKCTACRKCAQFCEYNAIALLKKPLVFEELCHGCGGCKLVCPSGAISEKDRPIGVVEAGHAGKVSFAQGRLNVGEPMSPPLIRAVKNKSAGSGVVIFDAPPGTSCPVVATAKGVDRIILVTEPTPFGLNDLKLAVNLVKQMRVPFGVVINRADMGDGSVRDFCANEKLKVLLEIPDDRRVAEAYSRGVMMTKALREYRKMFELFAHEIVKWSGV